MIFEIKYLADCLNNEIDESAKERKGKVEQYFTDERIYPIAIYSKITKKIYDYGYIITYLTSKGKRINIRNNAKSSFNISLGNLYLRDFINLEEVNTFLEKLIKELKEN